MAAIAENGVKEIADASISVTTGSENQATASPFSPIIGLPISVEPTEAVANTSPISEVPDSPIYSPPTVSEIAEAIASAISPVIAAVISPVNSRKMTPRVILTRLKTRTFQDN